MQLEFVFLFFCMLHFQQNMLNSSELRTILPNLIPCKIRQFLSFMWLDIHGDVIIEKSLTDLDLGTTSKNQDLLGCFTWVLLCDNTVWVIQQQRYIGVCKFYGEYELHETLWYRCEM